MIGYKVVVLEIHDERTRQLIRAAEKVGTVRWGQWGTSRGYFWFSGAPGPALRALRDAIGGEPVREADWNEGRDAVAEAARRIGNKTIASG